MEAIDALKRARAAARSGGRAERYKHVVIMDVGDVALSDFTAECRAALGEARSTRRAMAPRARQDWEGWGDGGDGEDGGGSLWQR